MTAIPVRIFSLFFLQRNRALLFALLLFTSFLPNTARAHILDVASGQYIDFERMIADLKETDFVFIGELHDRVDHHQAQLQVITALVEEGAPIAIGLEMFRTESQQVLDSWVQGEMAEEDFIGFFNENWSMWPVYRPIFLFAREKRIPLLGLNIPRGISAQVAKEGFSSLSPNQLARLPSVSCDVSPQYLDFIRRSLGGHAYGMKNFENFCEAQMLWDSVMAKKLLSFHQDHPGYTVVTLAGSGHAWKFGIPEQLLRASETSIRVLLPEIAGRLDLNTIVPDLADYLLLGVDQAPLH